MVVGHQAVVASPGQKRVIQSCEKGHFYYLFLSTWNETLEQKSASVAKFYASLNVCLGQPKATEESNSDVVSETQECPYCEGPIATSCFPDHTWDCKAKLDVNEDHDRCPFCTKFVRRFGPRRDWDREDHYEDCYRLGLKTLIGMMKTSHKT